jgi:diguanylate cyclase (GGDEF)-like protein
MRVLIVEDSRASLAILERAVGALGHRCLTAGDGLSAWKLFCDEGADVVISGWVMPGIEGDELCRRVRSSEHYAYFILLSAHGDKGHVMRGMEAGADDFLHKPLDLDELEARLAAASRVTALHRQLSVQHAELRRLSETASAQARCDPLTGIGNRLRMTEDLEVLESRATRYGQRYAVALCDIDHFKAYNDACGHQAGDEALRRVAQALAANCRSGDMVYRYGGEEMLIVLAEQELAGALAAGERMRAVVEALRIAHPKSLAGDLVTISVGVAQSGEGDARTGAGLVEAADAALYRAKAAGRNQVAGGEQVAAATSS